MPELRRRAASSAPRCSSSRAPTLTHRPSTPRPRRPPTGSTSVRASIAEPGKYLAIYADGRARVIELEGRLVADRAQRLSGHPPRRPDRLAPPRGGRPHPRGRAPRARRPQHERHLRQRRGRRLEPARRRRRAPDRPLHAARDRVRGRARGHGLGRARGGAAAGAAERWPRPRRRAPARSAACATRTTGRPVDLGHARVEHAEVRRALGGELERLLGVAAPPPPRSRRARAGSAIRLTTFSSAAATRTRPAGGAGSGLAAGAAAPSAGPPISSSSAGSSAPRPPGLESRPRTERCRSSGMKGLVMYSLAPASRPSLDALPLGAGAQQDDRDRLRLGLARSCARDLAAVELRHHHVEDAEVGRALHGQRRAPPRRRAAPTTS